MRAIFLDIDGVICCNQQGRLEDRKLQLLRAVVQATGAKVVLSTDWRRIPKLKAQLTQTLISYGMDVIGATPMRAPWQPVRPIEITDWIAAYNQQATCTGQEPITSFVAVDDRSLLYENGGDGLRGRFVHTRNMTGLTDKAAERMKDVLITGGEPNSAPIPGLGTSPLGDSASYLSAQQGAPGPSVTAGAPGTPPAIQQPFKDSALARHNEREWPPRRTPLTGGPASPFRDATEPSTGSLEGMGGGSPLGTPGTGSTSTTAVVGVRGGGASIFSNGVGGSALGSRAAALGPPRGSTAGRPIYRARDAFNSPGGTPGMGGMSMAPEPTRLPNVAGTRSLVQPRPRTHTAAPAFARHVPSGVPPPHTSLAGAAAVQYRVATRPVPGY